MGTLRRRLQQAGWGAVAGLVFACAPEGSDSISGTIRLASGLQASLAESDAVFVVARAARKPGTPPLAVLKLLGGRLPMAYRIGQEDVLVPGTFLRGPLEIRVVVRRSGLVSLPGPTDLEGEASGTVEPGAEGVDVELRRPS